MFSRDGVLFRQVNQVFRDQYDLLMRSGLYASLVSDGLLVPHEEVDVSLAASDGAYRVLRPERVPFVSYPYEWCFGQLQDAALATLEIQRMAMDRGMSLRDASAYNIQFRDGRPVLIDSLSFEQLPEGKPWVAYRQFCQHFLAPLALMAYADVRLGQLARVHIDGIPLDLAAELLPFRARLRIPLLLHVFLHARSQRRHQAAGAGGKAPKPSRAFSLQAFKGVIDSLHKAVAKLRWNPSGSPWAGYYAEAESYSPPALEHKKEVVASFLDHARPGTVWDLGANTGLFSRLAAARGAMTVSFDVDPASVEANYRQVRTNHDRGLLPLVLDLANPSPAIGWENAERQSLLARGPADMALALALVHHLGIGNNVPLDRVADFLRRTCTWLAVEFVPKSDPKVRTLLATREDVFPDYSAEGFEKAFAGSFGVERKEPIRDSGRILYLMRGRYGGVAMSEGGGSSPTARRPPWSRLVFHPILFAAFPVLYLYASNVREGVPVIDLLRPLALVLAVTAAVFAGLSLALRNPRRAGLAVSALVLLFFSYGHVYLWLQGQQVVGLSVGGHAVLLTLWAILAVGAVILAVRAGPRLLEATSILNVVALGLVLINVATILQYEARARAAEHAAIHAGDAGFTGTLPDPGRVKLDQQRLTGRTSPPDIYYIILEEYAGETGLRDVFHFDNTPFLSFLENDGFSVPHESTTNYPRTALSVASSLNMEYLDFLTDQVGKDSDDTQPLTRLLQYSRVARFLKSIGYRYLQIGSWWPPTAQSPIADQNIVYGGLSEFSTVLYKTTVLQPLKEDAFRIREWKRAQFQFAALSKIHTEKGPNFVFAHILVPHDPYVFNPDGSYVSEGESARRSTTEDYVNQVQYANSRVEQLVTQLLAGPENTRPVIIVQSDEGPYAGEPTSWRRIRTAALERKFPILNAYYLPGVGSAGLSPTITPVNTFRVVLNEYFDANLPILPDANYVFLSLKHLYDFTDVTAEVRPLLEAPSG